MTAIAADAELDRQDEDVFLRPGDAIELDGKVWVVQSKSTKPAGYIFADPEVEGVDHKMANRDIKDWFARRRLRFIMSGEHRLPLGKRNSLRRTMRAFSAIERKEMFRRARYCRAIDARGPGFPRSKASMSPICDELAEARGDTGAHDWVTVNRWWNDWDRAGRDIRVLCPSFRERGNRERRLEGYMLAAVERGVQAWLRAGRPKMSTHYADVVSECAKHHGGVAAAKAMLEKDPSLWLWPSYKSFTIACRKVDRTKKLLNRNGSQAARYEMYPVGEGHDVRLPFERVEADFKYLRIFVVDDKTGFPLGTPYLMAAIDYFTGMVAGFDIGFDPPSYTSAARCLRHVISHKDELKAFPRGEDGTPAIKNAWPVNGVPRMFVLDNDAVFHSKSFERSAQALGCHIDFVPPGRPWEKGKIERFWGTVQTSFVDMFPGNVLRIGQKPPVDYNPSKDATITLSQLRLFITKAIVDVHHIGIEPDTQQRRLDLWNDAVGRNPPRPVRDHESILELVGAYDARKAERRGIRIFGLRYNSPELATYRSGFEKDPRVEIRYDPQDIGEIFVIDERQGISFSVPCTRRDYAKGLTLHQHRVTQRRAKEVAGFGRLRMAELLLAKAELLELGRSMMKGAKTRRTSSRVAHFLGIGHDLLKEMNTRRQDEGVSDEPVELEDDIDDPIDDAQARNDEAEVDRLGRKAPVVPIAPPPPETAVKAAPVILTPVPPPRRASNIHVSIDDDD